MHTPISTLRPLTLAALLATAATPAAAATLSEAQDAYRTNHVPQAERLFGDLAADQAASPADRAEARRELGRIDWLVRGETDGIAAALAATPEGDERCATAALALRVYREAGTPETALSDAEAAAPNCARTHATEMRIQLARAHLALAQSAPADRATHLAAAARELDAIDAAARGAPEIAGPRLSLALAQRDAAASLAAWRAYYWLSDTDAPSGMPTYAGRVGAIFTAGLAPDAADADIIALIDLLIRAGFTDDARLLSTQTGVATRAAGTPAWRRAGAYFRFDTRLREILLRDNRALARGERAPRFEGDIQGAMGQLMQDAGLSGDPRAALAAAYGVYGTLGETSGYPSLHGGHLAQDEHFSVSQYGRTGELRFIVIDNMVSNGFESWLWDGWAETGGWQGDDGIVQVRSAYTGGPIASLRRIRPGPIRDAFLQRVAALEADERAALGRDGVASLPATSERIELQALEQIAQRVGDDDEAFIAEIWRATNQYSIEIHEGRHALDDADRHYSTPDLEFRAKLSQIALSDYPRLGLANVVGSTIGNTPHGIGNRRVLEGYRRWMRAHRADIAGFDSNLPTLSQLDKLTDEQIRTVARGMDPWARQGR